MDSTRNQLICVICQSQLVQEKNQHPRYDPFVISPCGHVFHRQCTMDWLERNPTCPTCRKPVKKCQKLFFAQDEHPAEPQSELETMQEEMPWYTKYATELAFAGGAIIGGLVCAVIGAALSSKRNEEVDNRDAAGRRRNGQ